MSTTQTDFVKNASIANGTITIVLEEGTPGHVGNDLADIVGHSLSQCKLEYIGYSWAQASKTLKVRYDKEATPLELESAMMRLTERINAQAKL